MRDHISNLAALGAPARQVMTAGFVGFGVLAPLWASTVPDRGARVALGAAGAGTLVVALLPLGGAGGGAPHASAAGAAYVGMALAPALGSKVFGARRTSVGVSTAAALMLAGSTFGPWAGALQRAGLGVVDAWIVVQAVRQLRH